VVVRGAGLFYQKACLYCHKIDGQGGDTGARPVGSGSAVDSRSIEFAAGERGRNMPAYGGLMKMDELAAMVAFLATRK